MTENMDERIKAIISAIVVIVVNAAALMGIDIGDGADIQDALFAIAWIASLAWAIWKNHNFTHAAAEGQRVVDAIKEIESLTGQKLSAEMALELTDGADHDGQQSN